MKTEATKTNLIHTVGHSNLSAESLVGMLKQRGITQVIDVRSTPYSRYVPQFNQNNIRLTLERNSTSYTHMGDALGGRPHDDRLYNRDGRANYGLMAQEKIFQDGIRQVERMAEDSHIAADVYRGRPAALPPDPAGIPGTGQQGNEYHPPDAGRTAGEPRRDYGKAAGGMETSP